MGEQAVVDAGSEAGICKCVWTPRTTEGYAIGLRCVPQHRQDGRVRSGWGVAAGMCTSQGSDSCISGTLSRRAGKVPGGRSTGAHSR